MAPRNVKMWIEDVEFLDMFDNVEFQYLKSIYDVEGFEFSMLDCCRGNHRIDVKISVQESNTGDIATFEFDLGMSMTRPFICKKRFYWDSPYGRKLCEILSNADDEEDEEIEEEEEDDEPDKISKSIVADIIAKVVM